VRCDSRADALQSAIVQAAIREARAIATRRCPRVDRL
jgi:hypothetical protein